jgi:hypothetical protein
MTYRMSVFDKFYRTGNGLLRKSKIYWIGSPQVGIVVRHNVCYLSGLELEEVETAAREA